MPRWPQRTLADTDIRIIRGLRRKVQYLRELLAETLDNLEAPDKFYERPEPETEEFFTRVEKALKRR